MDTKPWWQSKTIIAGIGTAISLLVMLAKGFFQVDITDQAAIVSDGLLGLLALIGALVTIWGRFTAKTVIGSDPGPRPARS